MGYALPFHPFVRKPNVTMLYPLLLGPGLLAPSLRPDAPPAPPPMTRRLAAFSTTPAGDEDSDAFDGSAVEARMVRLINADREADGLPRLRFDYDLVLAARSHCRDMRDRGCFGHESPLRGERTPQDRYRSERARMGERVPAAPAVGENIFYRSRPARDEAALDHQALMNSPGHRANILDVRYTRVGVGVLRDAGGEVWVTEMFLRDGS